jgi:hypothetical protein
MDTRTGRVVVLSPEDEQRMLDDMKAGKHTNYVPVRPDEVERVRNMNRRQRRAFVAQRRAAMCAKGRRAKRG